MLTLEQYNALLADAADPVKLPEVLTKLRDEANEMYTSLTTAKKKAETDEATIKQLQEVNMRMFLKGGQDVQQEDEPHEKTPEEIDADFRARLLNIKEENNAGKES